MQNATLLEGVSICWSYTFLKANLNEYNWVKHPTGSSIATATKRSYKVPKVFNPCNSGFRCICRITWHFVSFYCRWSKLIFWWSRSISSNEGLSSDLGFRIKSEKLPLFNFFFYVMYKYYILAYDCCGSCSEFMVYTRNLLK